MRTALFLGIALLIFVPFNVVTIRALLRIHPRWRAAIIAAAVAGNLMWPFFPLLRSSTAFFRVVRALLGPLWFGWTSFAILYSALILLVAIVWGLVSIARRDRPSFVAAARWPSRLFLALGLVATPIGIYHALVPLRVERVPIFIRNLPADAEGMRIAMLSDLHVGLFTRPSRLDRIFSTTRELRPDVAVILGDLIDDDPYFVPKLLRGTDALGPSIPLLAVLGNHEIYGNPQQVIRGLKDSRIRLLVNEHVVLRSVVLAGVSEYAAMTMPEHRALVPDFERMLSGAPANAATVVLSHQPKAWDEATQRKLPLTLAGHTHGGQCGFRPLRWSLAGVFLKYHMGLYERALSQLYITTGTGYWLVPFRLGMTPEITLIELRRAAP